MIMDYNIDQPPVDPHAPNTSHLPTSPYSVHQPPGTILDSGFKQEMRKLGYKL